MKLLSAASEREHIGVPGHECRPGCGILAPLPSAVLTILFRLFIFHIARASSFDAARSYQAVNLSCYIDWSRIDRPSPFVNVVFAPCCFDTYIARGGRPRDANCDVLCSEARIPIPWKEGIDRAAIRDLTSPQRLIQEFFLKVESPTPEEERAPECDVEMGTADRAVDDA